MNVTSQPKVMAKMIAAAVITIIESVSITATPMVAITYVVIKTGTAFRKLMATLVPEIATGKIVVVTTS